jgi:hypothetical protein
MNKQFFTNDEAFRALLEKQNELTLWDLGKLYVTQEQKRITLNDLTEDISHFLYNNNYDFDIDPEMDEDFARAAAVIFVANLNDDEVFRLYDHYIEPWTALEDLMELTEKERLPVIAYIMGWNMNDVGKLDTIHLN